MIELVGGKKLGMVVRGSFQSTGASDVTSGFVSTLFTIPALSDPKQVPFSTGDLTK